MKNIGLPEKMGFTVLFLLLLCSFTGCTTEIENLLSSDAAASSQHFSSILESIDRNASETSQVNESRTSKIIEMDDLKLGTYQVQMSFTDFTNRMTEKPKNIQTDDENQDIGMVTYIYADLEVSFVSGECYSIKTTSIKYPTPRDLAVGDSGSKAVLLYGEPYYKNDNVWIYKYQGGQDYDVFKITIINDKVTEIFVSLVM